MLMPPLLLLMSHYVTTSLFELFSAAILMPNITPSLRHAAVTIA